MTKSVISREQRTKNDYEECATRVEKLRLRERSSTCEVLAKRKARDLCPVLFESNCCQLMAAAWVSYRAESEAPADAVPL
jgi:hypothetical protein